MAQNSKKRYLNRPTAAAYKREQRWLRNAEKRKARIGKTFNKRREAAKQELLKQYPQLSRFKLSRWTLTSLRKRVKRYHTQGA